MSLPSTAIAVLLGGPSAEHDVSLAGGAGRITLQEPTTSWQRLRTELELGADECLILIAEDFGVGP